MGDPAKKIERFLKGWDEKAYGLLMPDGKYDKATDKFLTWEERLLPLTIFGAYRLGQTEGEEYSKTAR